MLLSRNKLTIACRRHTFALVLASLCLLSVPAAAGSNPVYQHRFVDQEHEIPRVHAASMVELNGKLATVWYAGSREGAADVAIYLSVLEQKTGTWSNDRKLYDRASTQKSLGRYIKKLGNPVLGVDATGKLWLYFVSVSAGGWSGSAINYSISTDQGETWSAPKRLVTSPFFNVSTLVRTQPFNFADGSIGLPVYHELLGKFAELLHLQPDGTVLGKHRISWGRTTLQPSIVQTGKNEMLALMRNGGNALEGVLSSRSTDDGRTWAPVKSTGLTSFESSVAAIRGKKDRLLLVFNNSKTNRNVLSLAVSTDLGKTWRVVHDFENSKEKDNEYSYPSLLQDGDGNYHVVYTWLRKRIKHVQFNEAWLEKVINKAGGS